MMTIRQALRWGAQALAAVPDPEVDAVALLCRATGMEAMNLRLSAQDSLPPEQEERFRSLLLLRAQRQPLQYLLGEANFFGRPFAVDPRVLIPRPETETLCELALAFLSPIPSPRALDVCTGSGAIAVTLCCERAGLDMTATELSPDALTLAAENARRNGADVRFLQGDLLAPAQGETFDAILSNPPYIPTGALDSLQPEVRLEPRLALDGGADGLDFYRRLAVEALPCLTEGGSLFLEVGDHQSKAVMALINATGGYEAAAVYRDLFGRDRCVTARRASGHL